MNTKQANRVILIATVWGAIGVACNLVSTVILFTQEGNVPFNPGVKIPWNPYYQLGNTFLGIILVFGMYKKNLLCVVALIANVVLRTAYILIVTDQFIFFMPAISIVLFTWAMFGIISLKRLSAMQSTTQTKPQRISNQ